VYAGSVFIKAPFTKMNDPAIFAGHLGHAFPVNDANCDIVI